MHWIDFAFGRLEAPHPGFGRYYAEFVCHRPVKLVIEVDGWTHNSSGYDAERDRFMRTEGYTVLRVTNEDVMRNLDGVVQTILAELS